MFKLLKNGDVYAPEHLGVLDVLLCGNKIVLVGENLRCEYPDTTVIDCTGKKIVPGFIDQHVHITGGGGESGFTTKVTEIGLSDCVAAGVTTLVGVLGTDSISRNVESVVAKAKALTESGLTCYCLTGSYDYPSPTITGSVEKDIAFIQEVLGVKICISDHRYSGLTKEDLTRLAAKTRVAGMIGKKPGVVHMHMGKGKAGLRDVFAILEETDIPIKQFRPTHAKNQMDDIRKFAQLGGYVDFTSGDDPEGCSDLMMTYLKDCPLDLLTLSSDSNGSAPIWNEKNELIGIGAGKISTLYEVIRALVVKHNMPLSEALKPITETVARALDLYPVKGCIRSGSDADLVLLNSDLYLDGVIAKGEVVMKDGKTLVKGYFEK